MVRITHLQSGILYSAKLANSVPDYKIFTPATPQELNFLCTVHSFPESYLEGWLHQNGGTNQERGKQDIQETEDPTQKEKGFPRGWEKEMIKMSAVSKAQGTLAQMEGQNALGAVSKNRKLTGYTKRFNTQSEDMQFWWRIWA